MKKEALLLEIKELFEWVSSRYSDDKDNLTAKDMEELRLRVRSMQMHIDK